MSTALANSESVLRIALALATCVAAFMLLVLLYSIRNHNDSQPKARDLTTDRKLDDGTFYYGSADVAKPVATEKTNT